MVVRSRSCGVPRASSIPSSFSCLPVPSSSVLYALSYHTIPYWYGELKTPSYTLCCECLFNIRTIPHQQHNYGTLSDCYCSRAGDRPFFCCVTVLSNNNIYGPKNKKFATFFIWGRRNFPTRAIPLKIAREARSLAHPETKQ